GRIDESLEAGEFEFGQSHGTAAGGGCRAKNRLNDITRGFMARPACSAMRCIERESARRQAVTAGL
ncbi:MAG: hypothetical protein Q8M64_13110, partial [Methyloversatilis sp.]|nr:hypothetical protein [Methyloversatilis sp.]